MALIAIGLMLAPEAHSQDYTLGLPFDITQSKGSEVNPSITINPANPSDIFAISVLESGGVVNPLVATRTLDGGKTWFTNHIATGADDLIPAYGYPSAAFDTFSNLYIAYIPDTFEGVAIAVSINFGVSFTPLALLAAADAIETPRIAAGPATAPGSVWVVYKDFSQPSTPLVAQGLVSTEFGTNAAFGQPMNIPGSSSGGFPDIAIGPTGQVMVAFQNNLANSGDSKVFVSLNANPSPTNDFGAPVTVANNAVGGLTYIPAQSTGIGVSADAGISWDVDPYSLYYGNAYIIYSALDKTGALNIEFQSSTNNGATWSKAKTVNDDASGNSHFMPRVAVDPVTGIIACSWYDCRNDQGSSSTPSILTFTYTMTLHNLAATNITFKTNGINNASLDIQTNSDGNGGFILDISGANLLGTLVSNNNTNIVYVASTQKPYITFTLEGNTGTNATGTNTSVEVVITDTLPDVFTSGADANKEPVVYTTVSTTGGASFAANQLADAADLIINPNALVNPPVFGFGSLDAGSGSPLGFGNYTGLAFSSGKFFTVWADNSDAPLTNPDGPLGGFDVELVEGVVPLADLTVVVTNSPNPVLSDGVVIYSIQAINNGPSASTCVVTDTLPDNVAFESAVPSLGATYSVTGQQIILTIPSLGAHSSATSLVLVTAGTSGYGTNIAVVAGTLTDYDEANNTNILVTLFTGEDLALTMSTSESNLYGGEFVTNIISVTNLGPSANGDVIISNVFSPNWGQLTVLSDGWTLAPNSVTTGTYSTNNNVLVLNVGNLGSNQFTNIVVSALALATSPNGSSEASVSSLDFDTDQQNNTASVSATMTPESIGAGITAGPSQAGMPVTFTIVVTNFGPSPFGFITVTNTLPPNFGTINVVQSPIPPTISGNVIVFPVGVLGVGATAKIVFTAIPQSQGTVVDTIVASCFDYAPDTTASVQLTPSKPATPIENFQVIPAASGAFVVWDTPVNATAQVDYGLSVTYGSASAVSGPATHHVVLLSGLLRDTNYFFDALTWENGVLYVTNGAFSTVGSLILNTQDAEYVGLWTASTSGAGILGTYYQAADTTVSVPSASATYTPMIPFSGKYNVSIWYPQSAVFSTNTPIHVSGATNQVLVNVNQTANGGTWQPLAQDLYFAAGATGNVVIDNNSGVTNKGVAANGVRWVYDVTQDSTTAGALPSWWSSFFFGTNAVSGSADTDGDGYSNFAEFAFGTDPTDPSSKLNMTVTPMAGGMVTVKFAPFQGGRVYQLLSSTDLANSPWLTLTNSAAQDANGNGVFTVSQPGASSAFYRLSATVSP